MRPLRLLGATTAVLVLTATAAVAHPSFNPNAVPIGQPVDTVLVVPHGCSTTDEVRPEDSSQAVPTTRVDLQLLDGMSIEPREVDGWDATDDGEAIVWTDAGGATTDPIELPITLTVTDGQPGDRLDLAVYQECEDGSSYRWTAGSSDTPAVRLDLTEGETGTVEVPMDHGDMDMGEDTSTPTDEPTSATPTEDATTSPADEATEEPAAASAEDDDGNGSLAAVVAAVVVLLAAGGTMLARRRRS